MVKEKYYRIDSILSDLPAIGKVIETDKVFDINRIARFAELKSIFEKTYNYSDQYNLPVATILELISTMNTPRFNLLYSRIEVGKDQVNSIIEDVNKANLQLNKEGRFFFDYILTIAKKKIFDEKKIDLPDRFLSKYFFENLGDCYSYIREFGIGKIIEVKFIEVNYLLRADNKLLSSFENDATSKDLLKQSEDFLLGVETLNPVYEIVFRGKYQITKHINF